MPAYNFYVPPKIIQSILAIPPADLVAQDFLKTSDANSYLCPICENAVISANLISGAYIYHCDNCDDSFNNFRIFTDFFGKDFFGKDFFELCKNICAWFNIKFNTSKKQDFINFDIQNARAGLNDCQKINFKGLTFETLSHFNCGFIHDWSPVKYRSSKNEAHSPRIIVPSQNHYSAFPLSKNSPTLHEGTIFPFNFDSISADAVNIVVENEFDAMTIWQVTGGKFPVVAIFDYDNGAQVFFNELQRKFAQDIKPRFLILFKPDKQGRLAAPDFQKQLNAQNFPAAYNFLMDWETSTTFNDFLYEEGAAVLADKIFSFVQNINFDLEKFAKDNSIGVNSMKLDDLKAQIKNIPPDDLAALGVIVPARTKANGISTYICPNCGNGNGDSGDGIAFEYKDGAWLAKCFKCGEGYDNLKLLALHYGLNIQTDFKEILSRAADDFSIATDTAAPPKFAPPPKAAETLAQDNKELELIQADISNAAKNIEFLPLDCRRGLSIDTLKKFNCGFIENWKSPKSRVTDTFSTPTPRLIVPSGNHYLARLTVPVETFPADVQKYIRPKQHAGKKALFGAVTITDKTEIIYVFEGEIDAMSAWQAYESDFNIASICAFVATCGAAEQKWLAEVDNICKGFNIKPRFKIFFDNDDAGKDWAIKHRAELLRRGYLAIFKTFADYGKDKIDANNILQEHGEEMLINKLFYADDSDLFAAAKIEIDELERKLLAEKAAADKAAKEKDILQKMFTLPFSDMYNADRINLLFGDIIRYSEDSGEWMFFKNGAWTFGNDSVAVLYPFARETAEFIDKNRPKFHYKKNSSGGLTLDNSKQQPADSDSVKFGETLARKWQERKTQRAAIDLLKGIKGILVKHNDLDKNPMLLNVKNGVVDLETGKLYPAAPELLLSKQANVIFNPAVRAPVFEKFIQDILPDEMTRRAVLRYLGYCLTGRVNSEKSLFVKGKGGNGKGTLFNTVLKMFGGYGTAFNINALLKPKYPKDGEAATPEFAKLEGARFVVVDEMPRGALFDVAKFKSVTGSDPIPIRPLFQPARVIENPTHKFVFSGNNIPDVESADDDGFNRRFSIAVFPMQFKGENADITLKSRLVAADELSGILNILLAECQAWQAEGLIESEEMQTQKQKYLVENDFIRAFVFEECEVGEGYAVARKALLAALRRYDARAHMYKDFQLAEMVQHIDGVQCVKSGRRTEFKGAWIFTGIKFVGNDEADVPFD